ncbi:MAG: HypC/HybG/HupF family hydrogenase formation chaperone [Candidatus Freyarchaeota archaeon]|nr:HypC/HybG/HupF family hydrogenase formation chaperone [Candidatus Freyrarchaeum guaymaensis]
MGVLRELVDVCLGVPAKVLEVRGERAIVDFGGVVREAFITLLDDVRVGDYVMIHTGYAIEKLKPEEAEETLKLLREVMELGKEGANITL